MDAQDAVGSDKTKPAASPKQRSTPQPDENASVKVASKFSSSDGPSNPAPSPTRDSKPVLNPPRPADADDDAASGDRDSDAETIVLPGKDGHSPSKVRKVKHEDGSDAEVQRGRKRSGNGSSRDGDAGQGGPPPVSDAAAALTQHKKRLRVDKDTLRPDKPLKGQEGSSGLSSAPTSPPHHRRRTGPVAHDSESDADRRKRSPKLSMKDRAKSSDQLVSHKRKASRVGSEEDPEERKAARRRRIEDRDRADWLAPKEGVKGQQKDPKSASSRWRNDSQCRSVSPPVRTHRRSISSQLPPQHSNGLSQKKRRLPPPLRSTEYHSDESSASGSPHPRSSKMRNLSTPATADLNMSPAKMTQSKKHVDAHGQTALARACNKGEYDIAKQRLAERPGDLNVADYAGNTPLQSASINGFEDIVKLLIEAGCDVNCMNSVKDTPLLDAVDNGHLEVVKLLLAAGVNPRKANLEGEEPLDRISDDLDNAEEIRAALVEAKQKSSDLRRTSEEHHHADQPDQLSHGPDSPRRSPAPTSRRPVNSRATKIGNHHLYVNLDEKTLRAAAAKGDEETVTRVLQVKERYDDPEAMVAAARGGHSVVMELLLALGGANPDPAPVSSLPSEFATPMLAAIGQENIDVLKLLLSQANFDPTRKYRGSYYYQIAQQRQGTNWKEEEEILKNAFDAYKKSPRDGKTKSPGKRGQDSKRPGRNLVKEEPVPQRRNLSSPTRDGEPRKKAVPNRAITSPKEKRRSDSFTHQDEQTSPKRGSAKLKKDERLPAVAASDREASPATSQKLGSKPKRIESDMAALSSEGETVKPRRKLVSKGELRGERDKQRRASMVSTTSSVKDPASPRDPKHDETAERPKPELLTEKYHDRTKALKRDESRERLPGSGEPPSKRHRSSVTPPHSSKSDRDNAEGPAKRRRLDTEGKERRQRAADSADERSRSTQDGSAKPKASLRETDGDGQRTTLKPNSDTDSHRKDHTRHSDSDKSSIHVKSEDVDVDMRDAPPPKAPKELDDEKRRRDADVEAKDARRKEERQKEADKKRRDEREAREREAAKQRLVEEEEAKQRLEEEKRRKAREEKRRLAEEEKLRKAEEDKRIAEALAEEERLKREAEAKEAEEKKQREEAEAQRLRDEAERKRIEDEKRRRKEEEEEKQREEERVRQEKLAREAAEQARREKEEQARKALEDQERREREDRDRLEREAREAALRQAREDEERKRRALELPPLLRWLDQCADPCTLDIASRFQHIQGVRYDTVRPEAVGTPEGRAQWVFNFQVALILGEKDLRLGKYPSWERLLVTDLAKPDLVRRAFWRLEADQYALTSHKYRDLGAELPNYYGEGQDASVVGSSVLGELRRDAQAKFFKMDMFLVKLSDFLSVIPTIAHLQDFRLSVEYREIPEDEAQERAYQTPRRYRQDPGSERFMGFAPRNTYYVNAQKVGEDLPGLAATSKVPFPDHERRVPRRNGLQQVFPGEPDYAKLCFAQGLGHLVNARKSPSPSIPNGVHPSPISQTTDIDSVPDDHTARPTVVSSTTLGSDSQSQLVNGTHGNQETNPA
ncbi:Protein HOS4 like protein [Verticillium longisporum]|nr:Protein HOS4 like protein [Verticillium longisporum]